MLAFYRLLCISLTFSLARLLPFTRRLVNMETSSLNILKVTDLKQILKQAGLSTSGTKSDLVQRIIQSGVVIASSTPSVPPTFTTTTNQQQQQSQLLKEIDEDAILGGDGDDEKSVDLTIPNEDLLLGEGDGLNLGGSTSKLSSSLLSLDASTIIEPMVPAVKVQGSAALARRPPTIASHTAANEAKPIWAKPLATNIEEKKLLRAAKFGDPKLQGRAERFGVDTTPSVIVENQKILQRTERFGDSVSTKAKTIEEIAKIEKRKARFGEVTAPTKPTGDITKVAAKNEFISKRQERFGIIAAPPATNTKLGGGAGFKRNNGNNKAGTMPGFKRRRFQY